VRSAQHPKKGTGVVWFGVVKTGDFPGLQANQDFPTFGENCQGCADPAWRSAPSTIGTAGGGFLLRKKGDLFGPENRFWEVGEALACFSTLQPLFGDLGDAGRLHIDSGGP